MDGKNWIGIELRILGNKSFFNYVCPLGSLGSAARTSITRAESKDCGFEEEIILSPASMLHAASKLKSQSRQGKINRISETHGANAVSDARMADFRNNTHREGYAVVQRMPGFSSFVSNMRVSFRRYS